jgi:mycofactocin system glycosyltransferase
VTTVEVDPGARLHAGPAGALLVGGQPLRVLRLNPAAARVVARWQDEGGSPSGAAETALAARLHSGGLAVVRSDTSPYRAADVTVVVPARDRADALDRCLAGLRAGAPTSVPAGAPAAGAAPTGAPAARAPAARAPAARAPAAGAAAAGAPAGEATAGGVLPSDGGPRLLVVDDGSHDPAAVAAVAARHGAELVVRPVNGGPAAARNTGLAAVTTPLVAFVDSDCLLPPAWLDGLLPALADGTAIVGPRVVGAGGAGARALFETTAGPLDLGAAAGPVGAGTRVGYLPAAVLLCRRDALGAGFDEAMQVGEDVDLVWRVAEHGHPVRYEPRVVVRHETRTAFADWFAQRAGYGRGGAALAARHPGRLAPVVVSRWSLPALACLAARKPGWAAGCTALAAVGLWTRLPAAPGRTGEAVRLTSQGLGWTLLGLAEAAARPWLPAMLAASTVSRTARRATAAALAVRLVRTRHGRPPQQHPATWAALRVTDDLAYGTGVWHGALREREPGPLLPRIT